ncbi:hypothetical protein SHELI_v1c08370 [Spiroplasma helicoides]|uniref:Uncharacterized protein n=1 Tax=Spiroplasma helicoides TaxID=216938 RepID=A0A1B3SLG5_9MOLU|nr:hypothetical protein [Spiroplasma helicoides]AOG60786.1 hypothetical protein SHELI_v1c08370 [Spiroplasma helicoides]
MKKIKENKSKFLVFFISLFIVFVSKDLYVLNILIILTSFICIFFTILKTSKSLKNISNKGVLKDRFIQNRFYREFVQLLIKVLPVLFLMQGYNSIFANHETQTILQWFSYEIALILITLILLYVIYLFFKSIIKVCNKNLKSTLNKLKYLAKKYLFIIWNNKLFLYLTSKLFYLKSLFLRNVVNSYIQYISKKIDEIEATVWVGQTI